MASGKGYLAIAGFKKATTWGTPVVAGAGDGIGILGEDIEIATEEIEDQQIEGKNTQREADAGNIVVSGPLRTALRYEGLEPMIAQPFGTAGAPTTVDMTAKKHVFAVKDDLEGIFGTLAIEKIKDTLVHEFATVKLLGFTLRCQKGQRAEIEFRIAAHKVNENGGSGTNNTTTIDSITLPANRDWALFAQMQVQVNAQGGVGLGASDKLLDVESFEISVDRQFKVDEFNTRFGNLIDEPLQNDYGKFTGSIAFTKLRTGTGGNDTLFTASRTKAQQKMKVFFTSTKLAGSATQFFEHILWLPNVQFGRGTPKVSGRGLLAYSLPFMGWRAATAPTGFTYTDPLTYEVYSQRAGDALA